MKIRAITASPTGTHVNAWAPADWCMVPGQRPAGALIGPRTAIETLEVMRLVPAWRKALGRRSRLHALLAPMLIQLAIIACGRSGNGSDADPPAQALFAAAPAPLELRLEAPGQVRAGETVLLRLVLANRGDQPIDVELTGQPIAFDFVVVASDGTEVWRRLEGVPVAAILQPRTLAPGQEIAFSDSWDQQTNAGQTVPPGTYRVRGILPVATVPDGWSTEFQALELLP